MKHSWHSPISPIFSNDNNTGFPQTANLGGENRPHRTLTNHSYSTLLCSACLVSLRKRWISANQKHASFNPLHYVWVWSFEPEFWVKSQMAPDFPHSAILFPRANNGALVKSSTLYREFGAIWDASLTSILITRGSWQSQKESGYFPSPSRERETELHHSWELSAPSHWEIVYRKIS
jgi:hypothetical protein